jgi:DNA polymerase-3 subunit delta'
VRQAASAQAAREKHAAWRRQEVPESELKQLISVEQIEQEVLARMPFRPHEATTRWVIVREAERMPTTVANKLLKTLEEPPRDTHFVLLTHKPSALLSTIRSRCQIVRFGLLSESEIVSVLHELGLDEGVARQLGSMGDGSVGRALEFRDQALHQKRQDVVDEVLAALRVGTAAAYITMAEKTKTFDRRDLETVLLLLQRYFRGETLQHAGARPRHAAVNATRADIVRETQELFDSSANYNVQLTLEAMMVRLREVRA